MHNNVFHRADGSAVNLVRQVEAVWTNGEQIAGSNNWTTAGSTNVPSQWTGTLTGPSPGFANLASNDPRPAAGSPLSNATNPSPATPAAFPFPRPHFPPESHPPRHAVESVPSGRAFDCDLDIGAYERSPTVLTVWGLKWSKASALAWLTTPGATAYDVVKGSLPLLRSSGGDFFTSLESCLENDSTDAAASDVNAPSSGQGFFYLVRTAPGGTYDSSCPDQAAARDAGIQSSPFACP